MHHFLSSLISFSAPTNHSLSFLPLLLHFHSFPIVLSHLFLTCPTHTSLSFFSSSFLFFLSYLPLYPFHTSHFLTFIVLLSHISSFSRSTLFSPLFDFPSSHLTLFYSFLSFHFLPFFSPLFQSQLSYSPNLFYTYYFLSLPFIRPSLTSSFLYFLVLLLCLTSFPFLLSFLSSSNTSLAFHFLSVFYFRPFPFHTSHFLFKYCLVFLTSLPLVSLPPSLSCLPCVLLPLILFLPLITHFFSFTCLYLVHIFLFLSLNDFLPVVSHFFYFPSFTPLPSLLSCHVSLPFLLLPFLLLHLTSFPHFSSSFLFLSFTHFPLPFLSCPYPIFLFDLTSFSYSHVLSLRLILSSSQASLLFLLSCLTSFALFLSHLTSFPLNSPSPNYPNSTHSESNKRLMQMMCGLSDMLLWCEREEEREREGACVVCN